MAALVFIFAMCVTLAPSIAAQETTAVDSAIVLFNEAQNLQEKGDLKGAVKLYQSALGIFPEFPEASYQLGTALLSLGDNVGAEAKFRRALELRDDWTLAMTGLGSLLVTKGQLVEAEKLLTKAIAIEPNNPPALVALAELRITASGSKPQIEEVLGHITALTQKANPTPALWNARAGLELTLGKRDLAKESLSQALKIFGRYPLALFNLAEIFLTEGDVDRAKSIAESLTGAEPDKLHFLWASIYAAEGRADEAIKHLDQIKAPLATAGELRKRIVLATAANPAELEKQLEIDAKNVIILGRLCSLYRREAPEKAVDYCRRASEAEPSNPNHTIGFAAVLIQARQFEPAIITLKRILEIVPDNATARANLGTALFQLKRYEEAKKEFRWLSDAKSGVPAAYFFLALSHDQLGEYLDAMANYQIYLRSADPEVNKDEIDRVNFRLPALQKLIREGKGKKGK